LGRCSATALRGGRLASLTNHERPVQGNGGRNDATTDEVQRVGWNCELRQRVGPDTAPTLAGRPSARVGPYEALSGGKHRGVSMRGWTCDRGALFRDPARATAPTVDLNGTFRFADRLLTTPYPGGGPAVRLSFFVREAETTTAYITEPVGAVVARPGPRTQRGLLGATAVIAVRRPVPGNVRGDGSSRTVEPFDGQEQVFDHWKGTSACHRRTASAGREGNMGRQPFSSRLGA